jgi:hypothetical protein
MPAYKPDPIQKAIDRVLERALEWQRATANARCECGVRAKRSMAEVELSIVIDAYKAALSSKGKRFSSEAPTVTGRRRKFPDSTG